jgi:hypothetical protein
MDGNSDGLNRKDEIKENVKDDVTYRRKCICGGSTITPINLTYVSTILNVVFIVLFVVLFLRLENVKTRLAKLENDAEGSNGGIRTQSSTNQLGLFGSNDGNSDESVRRKNSSLTDSVRRRTNSTLKPTTSGPISLTTSEILKVI